MGEKREGGEGGVVMRVMGPCVRCEMININQDTGIILLFIFVLILYFFFIFYSLFSFSFL